MWQAYGGFQTTAYAVHKAVIHQTLVEALYKHLNERTRRIVAGFLSLVRCPKDKEAFSRALGIDQKTLRRGVRTLLGPSLPGKGRVRQHGGGQKSKEYQYPGFSKELERVVEDDVVGDPTSDKRWVKKKLASFQGLLFERGMPASITTIYNNLRKLKITLKSHNKSLSTRQHPDRDRQFKRIKQIKNKFLKLGRPVLSVDTKKREKIGLFKQVGRVWRKVSQKVFEHDFPSLADQQVIPFGIYDIWDDMGYIYLETSHETSQFIVDMIVRWWAEVGRIIYSGQHHLLILCDAGGANRYKRRGWKYELQMRLVDQYRLTVTVCHSPPGASK
jgi:hypothetical protein